MSDGVSIPGTLLIGGFDMLKRFMNDESGATAIEYGLIAALIALAIIVGARAIGSNLGKTFNNIASNLT